jgi:hypothetical protein
MARKKEKENWCNRNVRRQFQGMDLMIEPFFSEIHGFRALPELSA